MRLGREKINKGEETKELYCYTGIILERSFLFYWQIQRIVTGAALKMLERVNESAAKIFKESWEHPRVCI